MMKIVCLFIVIILSNCTIYHGKIPSFYNQDTIKKEEMVNSNQGIVITNRLFVYNIVHLNHIDWLPFMTFSSWDGLSPSNDTVALKLDKGRYFIDSGLEIKRTNPCGIAIDTITKSCDSTPQINSQPAVIYFDVKPGEVIYVGRVHPNHNYRDDIYDEFEQDKQELSKSMPNIANTMVKKLMKKGFKPKECDFLSEKPEFCISEYPNESVKLDPRYPVCIKALEELK